MKMAKNWAGVKGSSFSYGIQQVKNDSAVSQRLFFRDAMGFILMFDLTNDHSLMCTRDWIDQLTTHAYTSTPDIVLCGNKVDLEDSRSVTSERAQEMAAELGLPYFETSAATGEGVEDAIDGLLTLVMARIERSLEEERQKRSNNESQTRRKSLRLPENMTGYGRKRAYYNSTVDLNQYDNQNNSSCSC